MGHLEVGVLERDVQPGSTVAVVGAGPIGLAAASRFGADTVLADVGVHGAPATLHLEDLWIRTVTVTTGLVDADSTPTLLDLVAQSRIDAGQCITHRSPMEDFLEAYDVFERAGETGALKIFLTS